MLVRECPVCFRPVEADMPECWECGAPMVLAKINSRPGLKESTPAPEPPRTHRGVSAALLALLVVAGLLAYRGPTTAGRLQIESVPAGALVRVGNRTLGVTPLQIEGAAGDYWVSIRLNDFEPVEARVMIPKAGRAIATVALRPEAQRRHSRRDMISGSAQPGATSAKTDEPPVPIADAAPQDSSHS